MKNALGINFKKILQRLRTSALYILSLCLIVLGIDIIWIVFFEGVRLELGSTVLRSTTIEFPTIAFMVILGCLFLLKGQWRETLLLVGALFIGGLMGESFLRMIDHPWAQPFVDANEWQEPSEMLGFTMAPNFQGRGPLDIWVETNSQGFRDDGEHSWAPPPNTLRILGLGDSFTFGWGMSLSESFLKKLEGNLKAKTGRNIETINSGVPGWNLNHYYVYYKEIGVRYSPHVVLLTMFWNDIPRAIQEKIPASSTHQKGWKHRGGIFYRSYLFNFAKSFSHYIRQKNQFKRIDYMHSIPARIDILKRDKWWLLTDRHPEATQVSTQILRTLLSRIQQLSKQHDGRLVAMFIPDVAQIHHPEVQFLNKVLAQTTEQLNIPFIDMTQIFESSPDPTSYYYWPRDFHTNAKGHEKIAETLTPLICQALQIEC